MDITFELILTAISISSLAISFYSIKEVKKIKTNIKVKGNSNISAGGNINVK
ncbi:hypothetical protein [Paenibacillus helianthi]|uniref:hypothetical protein n=1 Tax=Paenibacillus helianthi TaxID=1349432 RepID=UPI000AC6E062|nr:hypothetical protein [Paenibacillus helianthi]